MSNERAQARDNETTFGYGRPPVLTGALSLVVLLQRTRGPSQIATPATWQCEIPREHRLGPIPGCRRVAFAKVGVVYTAADIEELSARLIATTDPAAAHQLHELDSALAQLREQQPMDEVWFQQTSAQSNSNSRSRSGGLKERARAAVAIQCGDVASNGE